MYELKKALRRELIAKRRKMTADEKNAADSEIFERVKPLLDKAGAVFTYASTEIEVDTRRLINYCLERKIPTALPVSGEKELSFYFIDSADELKAGKFGIDEPPCVRPALANERTLCIVPALCADALGHRLGYGRGYYDRFLSGFKGESVILCYKDFIREVPTEPHDIRAKRVISDR